MAEGIDGFKCELFWNVKPEHGDHGELIIDDGNVGMVVNVIVNSDGIWTDHAVSDMDEHAVKGNRIIDWFRPRLEKLIWEFNYLDNEGGIEARMKEDER